MINTISYIYITECHSKMENAILKWKILFGEDLHHTNQSQSSQTLFLGSSGELHSLIQWLSFNAVLFIEPVDTPPD